MGLLIITKDGKTIRLVIEESRSQNLIALLNAYAFPNRLSDLFCFTYNLPCLPEGKVHL